MIIGGSCERDSDYCQPFTDCLRQAVSLLFLNFTVYTAVEACRPDTTSQPQTSPVHAGSADYLLFPRAFPPESLNLQATFLEELNCSEHRLLMRVWSAASSVGVT